MRAVGVATGIAWAFTRSPFIHAVSALDIDEMSGGRFRLGVRSPHLHLHRSGPDHVAIDGTVPELVDPPPGDTPVSGILHVR